MFDLQKFAEDEQNTEQIYEDVLDNDNAAADNDSPIPAELDGIPENIAREIMAMSAQKNEEMSDESASVPQNAELPQDTNTSKTPVTVPYTRFKEVIDKKNESEKQLAAYRERFGDLNSTQPQYSQPINQQPQQPQTQPQQAMLNADVAKRIDDAINQQALLLSGLSKEDVDQIDYFEDNDPRISRWNHAKKIAEVAVYNDIIQNQIAQRQLAEREAYLRAQTVNSYNDFVAQQQAAENFKNIQQFAEGDFFNSHSDVEKQVISDAYNRMRNNAGLPVDYIVIRSFFERAAAAYNQKQAQTPQSKYKSPPKQDNFPRTNQVGGTTGSGGGVSEASLAEMLQNKQWRNIPPEYQRMMLGV